MAGGIDWFRWHHGSVTDPKFQLVARKAGVRLPDVLAVWAFALESASASEERGTFGGLDHEAIDCLFGLEDGKTLAILKHMGERGLVDDGRICAWDKRQPKREREDDSSTSRVREFRQRQKQQNEDTKHDETPSNAKETPETPRGEERRVEEITPSLRSGVDAHAPTLPALACKAMRRAGLADVNPSHPKLTALLEAGITIDELTVAASESAKAGKPFAYALAKAEGMRRDGKTAPLPARPDGLSATAAALLGAQQKTRLDVIDV